MYKHDTSMRTANMIRFLLFNILGFYCLIFSFSFSFASNHYEIISLTRSSSGNWWDVKVKNTKKDEKIICILFDKNKKEVAFSDSWYADNMYTVVPINYPSSNVKYAHCISNN